MITYKLWLPKFTFFKEVEIGLKSYDGETIINFM